jgi:hypothetical protein
LLLLSLCCWCFASFFHGSVHCTCSSCYVPCFTIHLIKIFREGLFVNSLFTIFVRFSREHLSLLDAAINKIVALGLQIVNSVFTIIVDILGKLVCE